MSVARQVVAYHRSFVSKYYLDHFQPHSDAGRTKRTIAEIEEMRLRDPDAFEKARQSLAVMLKVPYKPGYYLPVDPEAQGNSLTPQWVTGTPSDIQVGDCMSPLNLSQSKRLAPETDAAALPLVACSHKAYINGERLYETQVFQKMDQFFDDYATPFEKVFSRLCLSSKGEFTPILNSSYEVIGHIGFICGNPAGLNLPGGTFVVPAKFARRIDLDYAIKNDIPVFVRDRAGTPEGWAPMGRYTKDDRIEVRVTIDGKVIDYRMQSAGGSAESEYSQRDLHAHADHSPKKAAEHSDNA